MRPTKKIDKLIKKLQTKASAELDQRVHCEISKALAESQKTTSAEIRPNAWRIIMKRPITKFAAAAVIVIVAGIFLVHLGPGEQRDTPAVSEAAKSSVEMSSVLIINRIYRKSGFDAVQQHLEKINEMKASPRRETITLSDILAELNGNGHERRQL